LQKQIFLNYWSAIYAMKTAQKGDTVAVEYTGKLETGETFDTSKGKPPLEFEIGKGMVIKGFEEGVIGMNVGEEKDITIAAEDGYGKRNKNYIKELPKKSIPKDLEIKEGMLLIFKREDSMRVPATIREIKDDTVKVDFNHPLAGKNLKFHVKLVEIK